MPTCTHVSRCNVRCRIRHFSPSCQSAAGCCAAFAPSRNGRNESSRFLTNIPTCRSLQWVFPQTGRDSLCGNSSGSHPPTFVPFAFFVAKNHSPRPPSSGWRASTPANPSGPPRPSHWPLATFPHWQHSRALLGIPSLTSHLQAWYNFSRNPQNRRFED